MKTALSMLLLSQVLFGNPQPQVVADNVAHFDLKQPLAQSAFSLEHRYDEPWVNQVFKDNILLTLKMLEAGGPLSKPINFEDINKPFTMSMTLEPQAVFAFHDAIPQKYKDKKIITTNAHFNADDGFRSSGFLYGDGVCHLASFINMVALDAGMQTEVPSKHSFRKMPDIPDSESVSIYAHPTDKQKYTNKNLYITNTYDYPVTFVFVFDGAQLTISVEK